METKYLQEIAATLKFSMKQVANIAELHDQGSTIPFIARYRKEATGNMDEVQINDVVEKLKYFAELDKRKDTILKTIESQQKLTPELRKRIEDCYDATVLEDIYLPFKPKRKTRATTAIEKGLEPLAKQIFEQSDSDPSAAAAAFVKDEVKDVKEALQGARDIIAEWVSEHEEARNKVRQLFKEAAVLKSRALTSKSAEPDAQKYRDYFAFEETLGKMPSHRLMAIRRGEKEGFLLMDIDIEKQGAIDELDRVFITRNSASASELRLAITDAFERLLKPSIENEFRVLSKTTADEEAIKVFADNLKQLLLAAPLGTKRVMALDPGFRTGCKLVCLDEHGHFLHNDTIYPHPPQQERQRSVQTIQSLVEKFNIDAIGIGNGTAGRETEELVRSITFPKPVSVFMVNESGASIYSASEVAREEFPDQDVTVRGAVSIGRRLLDPLSELVKIDPKSIGVGQYQHDVNQVKLKEELDRTVESCVNHVGVDLNTASRHLLNYVSGLSSTLAKNIVQYRQEHGAFKTRDELRKVALMGPKSFEQCAGFLRIRGAENPLDDSAVHPESYAVVRKMATDVGCTVPELIRKPELRAKINRKQYVSETAGEFTINDIIKELEKPGRDPRETIVEFRFDDTIKTMEDLKPGMKVPGIVTNITNFGAFVDIGVKQDGLVHISQLSNRYISDPNEAVKLQQQVMVTVTEVDVARKRIALSMKDAQSSPQNGGEKPASRPDRDKKPALGQGIKIVQDSPNAFQDKLAELKKRFK
jgi:protein Tex